MKIKRELDLGKKMAGTRRLALYTVWSRVSYSTNSYPPWRLLMYCIELGFLRQIQARAAPWRLDEARRILELNAYFVADGIYWATTTLVASHCREVAERWGDSAG